MTCFTNSLFKFTFKRYNDCINETISKSCLHFFIFYLKEVDFTHKTKSSDQLMITTTRP